MDQFPEACDFNIRQGPVGSRLERSQIQESDLYPLQLLHKPVEMFEHDTNLVLSSFHQPHFVPGIIAFTYQFDSGWRGAAAMHRDPGAKLLLLLGRKRAIN